MKLYATVTGQKYQDGVFIPVTKSQGSNDILSIEVQNEAQAKILDIKAWPSGINNPDCGLIIITLPSGKVIRHEFEKGEKQKDKKDWCTAGHKEFTSYCKPCADNIPF